MGNSLEVKYCRAVRAGGNHVVAATASGQRLGVSRNLKLRERELGPVLQEYRKLTKEARTSIPDRDETAEPPRRPVPQAPEGGLVVRGYCTYMAEEDGRAVRAKQWYYKQNPNRWAAETQSDMLWLTASEWRSLLPADPKPGKTVEVADTIQRRFSGTIGIDYMEGSVNSLATRQSTLTVTVTKVKGDVVDLRLDGYGHLGKAYDPDLKSEPRSRGGELRVLGFLRYDGGADKLTRFDVVGLGKAWGNKMEYVRREVRLGRSPWIYGIACELVTGQAAIDRIPPYNMLHYGGATRPYFAKGE